MTRHSFALTTVASLALLWSAAAADPVEPDESPDKPIDAYPSLDTVIVTGSGRTEAPNDTPYTVNILDSIDLNEHLTRSLPEAFEETPGVMVQKTAHGQGSPFIRGFTGFRNLLLIDGIRLNNAAFREGPNQYWSTVDPLAASQIELVKGQGSVLYGSDAIGGTVNVITKSADVFAHPDGQAFLGGNTFYRWASGEQSHTGRIEIDAGVGGRTGFHVGYTTRDLGDIRAAGLGELPKTGYTESGLDTRLDHYFADNLKLTLAYQQFEQDDVWRTHSTIFGRSWEGTSVGSERQRVLDQTRRLGYAQFEATELDGFVDEVKASVSWQRHEEAQDRVRSDSRRDVQGFDLDSVGASIQMASELPIGALLYGASYYRDTADSFRRDFRADGSFNRDRIQGPIGDDATYDLAGAFVQDRISIGERFDLLLGGRYTFARADIGGVEDPISGSAISINEDWHDISASIRGIWDLMGDESSILYGGVSQGFRAPNLSDLSRLDTARSNELETAAPGLDPEQFITYEIGTRILHDRFSGGLALYYTDIDDLIVRTPTGRMIDGNSEVTKRNGASGYVYGIELDASWELNDSLTLFGNFAWNDGRADTFPTSSPISDEESISRLLPPTGLIGLRWETSDDFWLEVSSQLVGKQDRLNTQDRADIQRIPTRGTPGYTLLNVRTGWQFTEDFLVTAAVENVIDEEYRAHGSGQNEPGINFVIGGAFSF
ncbi:MAG: TonB-dependent receptor [Verrucomicrobiae bacterium]|nr:TonB-dependent receptor [Verrucomicrobiae bacterium]